MPAPVAIITLQNQRTYRGVFTLPQDLRDAPITAVDGDIAQVHTLRRIYVYDADSGLTDDGDLILAPTGEPTGRWVCNVVSISGYPYAVINISGTTSTTGSGSSISSYDWILVDEPSGGVTPAVLLENLGAGLAALKIPVGTSWVPGGTMVFLRVTNNLGEQSGDNPFSPLTNQLSLFQFIAATKSEGFLVPPAGSRNWHRHYLAAVVATDAAVESLGGGGGGSDVTHTVKNKAQNPSGPAVGDGAVVPGITLASTPSKDSFVRVFVNGLVVNVGDGVDTGDCFFADPLTPAVPKDMADLTIDDVLVWNGVIAGYDLDASDLIDIDYQVSYPEAV